MNRRSFLRGMAGLASWSHFPVCRLRRADSEPSFSRLSLHRRNHTGRNSVQAQQRRLRRQVPARDAGLRLRLPRLRSRRLAGHSADQRCRLARPQEEALDASPLPQQRQRNLHRCDSRAGLDVELYGMGVAVGDYNNDGFPDILITCVGQNRLFRNTAKVLSST